MTDSVSDRKQKRMFYTESLQWLTVGIYCMLPDAGNDIMSVVSGG